MKILLIVPPNEFTLTRIPSIGLAWLAGYLRMNSDYEVKVLDCLRLKNRTLQIWLDDILEETYQVVGMMMFSRDVPVVKTLSTEIKKQNPNTYIVTGGAHISSLPGHTLRTLPDVDFEIRGEGEVPLLELCKWVERGGGDLSEVPALSYRENGKIKTNDQYFEENLDDLGFPAWDTIDPRTYPHQPHGVVSRSSLTAPIFATRGCPYRCTYCAAHLVTGYPIRYRSVGHVVEEMEMLHRDFNVGEFHIEDDNFTLDNKYAIKFCEEILRRNHNWKF